MSCRVMRRVSGPGSEPQEHSRRDRWSAQSGEPRWTRDGGPSVGRGVHTRQAAVFVALVQHLAVPGLRSRAFLSTATHGHRRKAQVFRPRYAVPKASNSKLNAAIQAGSTRCDIPTKMDAKTQNWPPQSYGQSGPSRQLSAAWDLAAGLPAPVCPSDHSTEPEHTVG
jgi:hypothetical protein